MSRLPRKQCEVNEARARVREAAASVFAKRGFQAATMQDIAEAADYSVPSLYSYFKSKQAILDALVEQIVTEAANLFELELPAGLTLLQRTELLLRHHNAWAEKHRDAFLFFVQGGGKSAVKHDGKPPPDVTGGYIAQLGVWLADNAAEEELHGRNPSDAAHALWGIYHAYFLKWVREGARDSLNAQLPLVLDLFFFGLQGRQLS